MRDRIKRKGPLNFPRQESGHIANSFTTPPPSWTQVSFQGLLGCKNPRKGSHQARNGKKCFGCLGVASLWNYFITMKLSANESTVMSELDQWEPGYISTRSTCGTSLTGQFSPPTPSRTWSRSCSPPTRGDSSQFATRSDWHIYFRL